MFIHNITKTLILCFTLIGFIDGNSTCRVQNLAGTQPDEICKMRDFLKFFNDKKRRTTNLGKNSLIIFGPIGTGKTIAAMAIGQEQDVILKYYTFNTLPWTEGPWLGAKIKNILLEAEKEAREKKKPVVIIFDNVDEISNKNIDSLPPEHKEAVQTIAHEISQYAHCSYMSVILVTVKIDKINDNLKRVCIPVKMGIPNYENRKEIIRHYAKYFQNDIPESFIDELANNYSDFSGREIEKGFLTAGNFARAKSQGTNIKPVGIEEIRQGFAVIRKSSDLDKSWAQKFTRSINEYFKNT